ncbi:hypothetical protein [Pseudomonas mediterranea]|uniref:hypothetical protein n=1 Tax=Pseudomonas mediterranea TaxID=183795 RepID=UPI0006D8946B|nr:hypothetical protein [Pseudomonas mediterranea]
MAIATDEDRKFMAENGFKLHGDTFGHADGRSIAAVWVNPVNTRQGTFWGGQLGCPVDRTCMWHAAKTSQYTDQFGDDWRTRPVGSPCESPIACFIQAELCQWT